MQSSEIQFLPNDSGNVAKKISAHRPKQKNSLVTFLQETLKNRSNYSDPNRPLPEGLSHALQHTAKFVDSLQASKDKSQKDTANQLVHGIAKMLKLILHPGTDNKYRILGLNENASPNQIRQHYQWLHRIFLYCGDKPDFNESVLRITEAYVSLRSELSDSKNAANEQLDTPKAFDIEINTSKNNENTQRASRKINLLKKGTGDISSSQKRILDLTHTPHLATAVFGIAALTISVIYVITHYESDPLATPIITETPQQSSGVKFVDTEEYTIYPDGEIIYWDQLKPWELENSELSVEGSTVSANTISEPLNIMPDKKPENNATPAREIRKPSQSALELLLTKAEKQMFLKKYTRPMGNNAYETYKEVLRIDPDNAQANTDLQLMVNFYQNKAELLFQQNNYKKAFKQITLGLSVQPQHQGLHSLLSRTMKKLKAQNMTIADWK